MHRHAAIVSIAGCVAILAVAGCGKSASNTSGTNVTTPGAGTSPTTAMNEWQTQTLPGHGTTTHGTSTIQPPRPPNVSTNAQVPNGTPIPRHPKTPQNPPNPQNPPDQNAQPGANIQPSGCAVPGGADAVVEALSAAQQGAGLVVQARAAKWVCSGSSGHFESDGSASQILVAPGASISVIDTDGSTKSLPAAQFSDWLGTHQSAPFYTLANANGQSGAWSKLVEQAG